MTTPKRGPGRPPKADADRQSERIPLHVTAAERETLEAWAQRAGQPLSSLVRETALRAARRALPRA